MNEIITLNNGNMTEAQAEAVKLHQSIMINAEMAASSMVAMCRDLKAMRDRKLYEELGFTEFADYTEKLVGIKARQAYNYISTYEKLGDTVLQSNASLGITKLGLIAQMSVEDRVEMLESGAAENMSVAEIKKLVEENKNQGEQISLLNETIDKLKDEVNTLSMPSDEPSDDEKEEVYIERIQELEKQLAEAKEKDEDDIPGYEAAEYEDRIKKLEEELAAEKAKKAAPPETVDKKKLTKEIEDKLAAEHNKKLEAERKKAHEAGKKEAEEEAKAQVELLKSQVEQSERHSAELQKELELSDSSSAEAKVYIASIQADFNALMGVIGKMDTEQQNKFKHAVMKLCDAIQEACEK